MATEVRGPFMLPPESYPFTIEWLRIDTREVVHTIVVEAPTGTALRAFEVPALRKQLGVRVGIRMTFPDGQVLERMPERGGENARRDGM